MVPDYTINDAVKDGFECGILYMLRYINECTNIDIPKDDISYLADHLAKKKPWKTRDEWAALLGCEWFTQVD